MRLMWKSIMLNDCSLCFSNDLVKFQAMVRLLANMWPGNGQAIDMHTNKKIPNNLSVDAVVLTFCNSVTILYAYT